MFHQILDPLHSVAGDTLLALVPVAVLLVLLAVFRMAAWKAVIVGSAVTIILAVAVWDAPVGDSFAAYGLGAATGLWSVNWIVFWGVIIYNTLVETGAFADFKDWLVAQATADIRVQTLLMAWSFGALMEGLVGFGYPWAVVAPILIALGMADLAAIRVAALANNAPVSFGALGAPIIGLASVTGLPLLDLSHAIGRIVAILALAPPWILIYLVSGTKGIRTGWPLAIVGSFGYIAGQFPIAEWVGPYLPDITGAIVSFIALFALLRVWRPKQVLGFGGYEISEADAQFHAQAAGPSDAPVADRPDEERAADPHRVGTRLADPPSTVPRGARSGNDQPHGMRIIRALVPFGILIAVVVAWTGPWSPLTSYVPFEPAVDFIASLNNQPGDASWKFAPAVAGTAILASWVLIVLFLRPDFNQLRRVFATTWKQMWGAFLVGPFIFGLAYVFNYSGMANSIANGFSKLGTGFVIFAPILGWIAVALSGSNTSANALFGQFQYSVGKLLGAPVLLFPSINSVGAETGKPVAPQTASVGVGTTSYARREGEVVRHNMAWTLVILAYLIGIGCLYYFVIPDAMRL